MSSSVKQPDESEPDSVIDIITAVRAALPGVVQSVMVIAHVVDGIISGVVLDSEEPGGGYISEQELAPNAVYLVIGVRARSDQPGVTIHN